MPRIGSEEYKEHVRTKIANVGLEVFARKGYRQTTMNDVAKQMNVSKPTIYLYFKNKEQLLRAISETHEARLNERLRQWVNEGNLWEYKTALDDGAKSLIQNERLLGLWMEILAEAPRNASIKKIAVENFETRRKIIEDALEDRRRKKLIHPKSDSRSLSIAFIALLIGHQVLQTLKIDESELNQVMRQFMRAILNVDYSMSKIKTPSFV